MSTLLLRVAMRNPRTFANVLAGHVRTEEEISHLVRSIQSEEKGN